MADVLETLVTQFTADLGPLKAGLTQAAQDSRRQGQQIGAGLTAGLSQGLDGQQPAEQFTRDINGKLRDSRGRFVKTGHDLGDAVADGMAQGVKAGGQQVEGALSGLTARLNAGAAGATPGLFARLTAGTGGLSAGLTSIIGLAGPVGAGIASIGAATAGTTRLVNSAINEFAKFEKGLAQVSTLTDRTPGQLQSTGREILNLSTELGMSFQDLNAGLADILGAGVRGTEDMGAALGFLKDASKLAIAGATDTATATDALTSIMNSFKLSASDTKAVSDGLFRTVQDGKISFNVLAGSIGNVTNIAAESGVPLQEVNAAIATMTANGLQGSTSIDYLRSAIAAILNPSSEAEKLAAKLGIEFNAAALKAKGLTGVLKDVMAATNGNTAQMAVLFGGIESMSAATAIASGNFERMETNLRNQASAAGSTETAYQKMAGTLQKENDKVSANWSKLMVNLGQAFAPLKAEVLSGINSMLDGLNKFIERLNLARNVNKPGNDVIKFEGELEGARAGKASVLDSMAQFKAAGQAIPKYLTDALATADAQIKDLTAKIAEAKAATTAARAEQAAYNMQQGTPDGMNRYGPQMYPTGGAAPTDDTNSSEYTGRVIRQAMRDTGVRTADEVVDYCAQWVRLTLGKADAKVAPIINKLFQTDNNRDGNTTANDAAANVRGAGLMRQFTGTRDLKPGDTVFYEDAGQGHVGIYIGGGMVRGNNRVSMAQTGDPVGNVDINRLGTVTGYARSSELAGFKGEVKPQPGATDDTPVSAAQIAKAQQLVAALEAAKKAHDPAAIAVATQAMEKWGKASDSNKAALDAVKLSLQGLTKASGDYLATQADVRKYGDDALKLIKAQEAAQKSGDAGRIASAKAALSAWVGESKAKAAVVQVEQTAYQVRQQAAEKATADTKRSNAEAEADARKLIAQQVQISEAVMREAKTRADKVASIQQAARQGRIKDAQNALDELTGNRDQELKLAGDSAAKRLEIEKRYQGDVLKAQRAILQAQYQDAVAAAKQRDDANTAADIKRAERERNTASRGLGRTATNRANDEATALATEQAARNAQQQVDAVTAFMQQKRAVIDLRAEYSKLADSIREQTEAGTFDAEAKQAATKAFNDLGRAAVAAGLDTEKHVEGARRSVWGLIKAGEEAKFIYDQLDLGGAIIDPETGNLLYQTEEQIRGIGQAGSDSAEKFYDLGSALENVGMFSKSELDTLITQSGLAEDAADALRQAWERVYGAIDTGPQLPDNLQGRGVTNEPGYDDPATGVLTEKDKTDLIARMDTMNLDDIGKVYADLILKGFKDSDLGKLIGDYLQQQADAITQNLLDNGGMTFDADGNEVFPSDADVRGQTPGSGTGEGNFYDTSTIDVGQFGSMKELQTFIDTVGLAGDAAQSLRERWQEQNAALLDMIKGYDDAGNAIYYTDAELRNIDPTLKDTTETVRDLAGAQKTLAGIQRDVAQALGETQTPYAAQIETLEELQKEYPELTAAIDQLIRKLKELQTTAAQDAGWKKAISTAEQWAKGVQQVGGIFDKITGQQKGAVSILGDWMQMNVTAAKQWTDGDFVGAIMTTVNGILDIGEAIAELNGGLKEWKKSLREVAEIEKQALGKSTGGIRSPWEDALKADMEAQEKLANSKWYQRLAWSIFGGAPEAMKTESAKALAEMQSIFADFAGSFSNILSTSLTDAFTKGDMSGWAENFSKAFDAQVGQIIIKTIIAAAFETGAAANDLADLTKAVKEERYGDIPPILERLKADAQAIGAGIAAVAPTFPGFGSGADGGAGGVPTGSLFGAAPSAQLGIPRLEVTLPDSVMRPLGEFAGAVPVFAEGARDFREGVRELRAAIRERQRPGQSPVSGLI